MQNIFVEIGAILLIAVVVSGIMTKFKQPLIIGYILTGLIVGPYFLNILHSEKTLEVFSSIGIALLLFVIGLSLNPKIIKEVGRISVVTGLGQIVFTTALGYAIGLLLGFDTETSIYIAIALTFSSTIIILKLLSDKKELNQLYGKISTGFLIVQDLAAALILIAIITVSRGDSIAFSIGKTFMIFIGAALFFVIFNKYIMAKLGKLFASSQEYLFLFALGWGFGIAALFAWLGLSIEIGAVFAGVVLANSPYNLEISSKLKPLRDFFLVIFFILLGSQIQTANIGQIILPAVVFSLFILVGNPLIVISLMGLMGYQKKTSFKAGLTVAQISEFSIILIVLVKDLGRINQEVVSLLTIVGIVTIAFSTYMIIYSDKLYGFLENYLNIFERKNIKTDSPINEKWDIIMIGYKTIGKRLVKSLQSADTKTLVIDYDPEVIDNLKSQNISYRYGDANDIELLNEVNISSAKLVVSTIDDINANILLVKEVKKNNRKNIVVVTSDEIEQAELLYEEGADYVMMPHYLGTMHTGELIKKSKFDLSLFIKEKEKHLDYILKLRDS